MARRLREAPWSGRFSRRADVGGERSLGEREREQWSDADALLTGTAYRVQCRRGAGPCRALPVPGAGEGVAERDEDFLY